MGSCRRSALSGLFTGWSFPDGRETRQFEKDARHLLYREYLKIIIDHAPPVFRDGERQGSSVREN